MPWPMVHFSIAEKLFSTKLTPNFLLGSIAPDAIHMRENTIRKDKGTIHLVSEDQLPSKDVIMSTCLQYLDMDSGIEWNEYVLGYFAHIYTDLRWTETVYAQFEINYNGESQDKRKVYNNEVSQVEFNLLKTESWTQDVILKLNGANGITIAPFVTEIEVNQYRDEKLNWLTNYKNEPHIIPIYFKEDCVSDFIINTSTELTELFKDWGIKYFEEGRNIS